MRRLSFPILLPILLLATAAAPAGAQESQMNEVKLPQKFLLTGYGFATYTDADEGQESAATLAPIVLFRFNDKLLFEAEGEFEAEDAEGEDTEYESELEYAQLDWLASDDLTVVLGKFLTPFGTFIERLHPAWINKLPTMPLPYGHGQSLVPFAQTGLQLRGGVPIGDGYGRFTYSLFVSNGFRLSAHGHGDEHGEEGDEHGEEGDEHGEEGDEHGEGDEHDEEGELFFFDSARLSNGDLAYGGRVSVAPVRGFEVGASYLSGGYDDDLELDAEMTGVDFLYHHDLFEFRGEWLDTTADSVAEDGDRLPDQEVEGWYFQSSLRLSVIPLYFFNKLELAARFARLDAHAAKTDQTTVGLNYYFTGSRVLRLAWEKTEQGDVSDDALAVMFAYGF